MIACRHVHVHKSTHTHTHLCARMPAVAGELPRLHTPLPHVPGCDQPRAGAALGLRDAVGGAPGRDGMWLSAAGSSKQPAAAISQQQPAAATSSSSQQARGAAQTNNNLTDQIRIAPQVGMPPAHNHVHTLESTVHNAYSFQGIENNASKGRVSAASLTRSPFICQTGFSRGFKTL